MFGRPPTDRPHVRAPKAQYRTRFAAVIACILVIAAGARADDRTDARRAFRAGMKAIADGRYEEGISQLERANQILPHPNVLYNLGLAHRYAGHDEEALLYFERYKEAFPEADQTEVDQWIRELRPPPEPEQPVLPPEPAAPAEPAPPVAPPAPPQKRASNERAETYDERVTSASRLSQSPLDAPNATAIITAQDIRMSGVTQLSALLRRVAGVEVASVAPYHAELSIRGLNQRSSNKVLLLLDGHPIRKDFNGSSWIDMLPVMVDDIERIEIIRGPASALYGADAFSGVINVITRAPGEGSFVVGRFGNGGQYQGAASFAGKVGRDISYRVTGGYLQAYNFARVVGPDRVDIRTPNGESKRGVNGIVANGDMRWQYAKRGTVSLGGNVLTGDVTIQGISRLHQVVADPAYEGQAYALVTTPVGIRISTTFDRLAGHPQPAYIAPGSIADARSFIRQELYDLDVSWSDDFELLVPQTFTVGGSYRFKYVDWTWLDEPHTQHLAGAYMQDVLQLAEPLRLQVGARIDHHPLLSSLQFSPRASLVYRFLDEQSLRLSGGRAFRGPTFMESYLHLPNETPLRGISGLGTGNRKLAPESIISMEVGYQNQLSSYFTLECNAYYNWVKNLILFTDSHSFTLSDFAGANPAAQYDPSKQAFPLATLSFANERAVYRQYGGELGVRAYPLPGLDVFVNYSLHKTEPLDPSKVDAVRRQEQQTSLHKVNTGVMYRARFGLDLSADVSWMSDQTWVEQVTDFDASLRWQSYHLPSFVMVNAHIGYRLFADVLELGVVGTNLASQGRRQHPFGQPLDTRVLGTGKVRF